MAVDRRHVATIVTILVLGAVLIFTMRREPPEPPEPEDLIWTLIEAAQTGDATTYLGCFDGKLRTDLDHTVSELTADGFADYLRSSSDPLTGVAVYDVEVTDGDRASLTVEYVYRDATERQRMQLELVKDDWKIVDLDRSKRAKPLIPYGAPAAPMPEPEPTETPTPADPYAGVDTPGETS
jgi:hypothetical protein